MVLPWTAAKALKHLKGKFLLTINDHVDIKKLYKGLNIRRVPVRYSVQRFGDQKNHELIITNYPLPKQR